MNQRKVPIDQATAAELREFASANLGIEIHPNCTQATALAKVKAAWDKPEILVAEEASHEQSGAQPSPATAAQAAPAEDKVRIKIPITDDPGGDEHVPVGVNGRVMLIPRDKEVDIPRPYYNVLMQAVSLRYEMDPSGQRMKDKPREVQSYPVQLIHDPAARAA